jgi:cyclopropane fatty-acyl-phospholipid synthase-like methyltransferase
MRSDPATPDVGDITRQYREAFAVHGRSTAAVLCPKGRQAQRFAALLEGCALAGGRLLDFGCGLGHLCDHLTKAGIDCDYLGVDMVDEFITSNREQMPSRRFQKITDISEIEGTFDVVLASGVFNLKYLPDETANMAYVQALIARLFEKADRALTIDFMTDLVDFRQERAFHPAPAEMLRFVASQLSRRYRIDHSYLPYEYCVTIFKTTEIDRSRGVYA